MIKLFVLIDYFLISSILFYLYFIVWMFQLPIIEFLEEKYPDKPLLPRDPIKRAQVALWKLFAIERMVPYWRSVIGQLSLPSLRGR